MEPINTEIIAKQLAGCHAAIKILDEHGSDQAPAVKKFIKKVQLCPDSTHIRLYFDDFYFLAVPLASESTLTETEWTAHDQESGLTYKVTL
ncbi:hypothetical protein RCG23_08580 [Neobacillus sp. PS3-34]|uniref:hypothetical protein n=1 Tax=Neobacillus sp. PS3-34 TaxID=3070678 RepID=UPI0027DF0301|nr:hypothetical protein [Neobacillus sp. PS3-34]WML49909.1 hypothetical protein RCG23_08580 [Neobacillus sp. PS3-34]